IHIFGIGHLFPPADVYMGIDKTGHDVHSGSIKFFTAGLQLRPPGFINRNAGIAHHMDSGNSVFLNDDIGRTDWWRKRTVNDDNTPYDELVPRALAFASVGCRANLAMACR